MSSAREDDVERLRGHRVAVAQQVGDVVVRMRLGGAEQCRPRASATDVVTAADTAARAVGPASCSRSGGPATGARRGGGRRRVDAGGMCWVVDPIDGTVNYPTGCPGIRCRWRRASTDSPWPAAVAQPAAGRLWSAARGGGALCDGVALRVSGATQLELSLIGTGFSYQPERRARQAAMVAGMLPRIRDMRRAGSAALDLCSVASGWLDGFAEHGLHRWDWAAGALIAAEAGAVVRLPPPRIRLPPGGDAGDRGLAGRADGAVRR